MLTMRDFPPEPEKLGKLFLAEVRPDNAYDTNGKRIDGAEPLGYRYGCVAPQKRSEKIFIKIPGKQLLKAIEGEIFEVEFQDLELYVYGQQNEVKGRAKGITAVSKKV